MRQYRIKKDGDNYFPQTRTVKFKVDIFGRDKFLYRTAWQKIGLHGRSEFSLYDESNNSYPQSVDSAQDAIIQYESKFYAEQPTYLYEYDQSVIQWYIQNKKPLKS